MDEQQPLRGNKRRKLEVTSISMVSEDVMLETLVRLPDYKCVIQCGLVCERWFHLISRSEHFNFSFNFNHHHRYKRQVVVPLPGRPDSKGSLLPYTLLYRDNDFESASI
ncbi:F-box domain containing protein [Parasponia andersonii]|uniref:F-box domain containing protein n=1 Tax=Parasponia andersonii TaxID=3476 RepID=A0A2P5CH96_PARAD|nr:F-box domain containing protein [Parasponia andersonii]